VNDDRNGSAALWRRLVFCDAVVGAPMLVDMGLLDGVSEKWIQWFVL
jgi:hypothetical protein